MTEPVAKNNKIILYRIYFSTIYMTILFKLQNYVFIF